MMNGDKYEMNAYAGVMCELKSNLRLHQKELTQMMLGIQWSRAISSYKYMHIWYTRSTPIQCHIRSTTCCIALFSISVSVYVWMCVRACVISKLPWEER